MYNQENRQKQIYLKQFIKTVFLSIDGLWSQLIYYYFVATLTLKCRRNIRQIGNHQNLRPCARTRTSSLCTLVASTVQASTLTMNINQLSNKINLKSGKSTSHCPILSCCRLICFLC